MSADIQLTVTRTGEFDAVFKEYLEWNKRQTAEIVNAKLYFIALRAMKTTKAASASAIRGSLSKKADKYPHMTVGEILTIMDLRSRHKLPKRTKTLAKNMAKYVQRFENKRVSHINFLRSGWIPVVKKLDYWNRKSDREGVSFSRRFAPKENMVGIKQFGKEKGRIIPARLNQPWVKGTIFNDVGEGKQVTSTIKAIKQEGLDKAVIQEINSMKIYIERKIQEHHNRMASRGNAGIKTHS